MKKNLLKTVILFLIVLIVISSFPMLCSANSVTYYNGNSINISNSNQIEILSTEVKIDTINSVIRTSTIIKNTSNKSRQETITLPIRNDIVETKIKTLKIVVNDVEVKYEKTDEKNYTFNIKMKPNETKKILVMYQTENDLKKAKVLKYNFEDLGLGDKIIKKAKVDIILQEKDIPLVTKVHPAHYTFKENIISIEYYNFKVNSITKNIIVEKETFDNLLYGRDVELTDVDKKILDVLPDWEKNGITINYNTDCVEFYNVGKEAKRIEINRVIKRLTGIEIVMDDNGKENISKNTKAITTYYIVKKLVNDNNNKYIDYFVSDNNNILVKDVILQNCTKSEELPLLGKMVCIDYVLTTNGEDLYVDKTTDASSECNIITELTKKDELTIITTNLYGLAKVPETGAKLVFLGKDIDATDEEKVEYVNMINADMYIRTMLYNGEYKKSQYEYSNDGYDGYVGYNGKDNLQIAKAFVKGDNNFKYTEYTEQQYYNEVLKENSSDYGLINSEIPCVIQYIGSVEQKDGKKVINYFWDGFYDFNNRGLATTSDVLQTDRAKQLLQVNKSKNEKIKQDIEKELSNLKIEKDEVVNEEIPDLVSNQEETVQNKSYVEKIKENLNTIIFISMGIVVALIIVCMIILIIRRKNK